MLDPEDNSTILPLQSGWGGGGVGDSRGGEGGVENQSNNNSVKDWPNITA